MGGKGGGEGGAYADVCTSIGTVNDTVRNPALRVRDNRKTGSGTNSEDEHLDARSRDIVPFLALAHNVPGVQPLVRAKDTNKYEPAWLLHNISQADVC